jgi:tetratricopeptide (TPR) repeat protein
MRESPAAGRFGETSRFAVVFSRRGLCAALWLSLLPAMSGATDAKLPERNKPPVAAPAPKARRPAPGAVNTSSLSSPPAHYAERAVVFDETYRLPAKDLLLNLEGERKADAIAHFLQGTMLEDSADTDSAVAEYLKSLNLDPGNTDLSIKLAWRYASQGNSAEAIGLLKDTIKALPKEPEPYLALSRLYFKVLGKNDLALKFASQALEIDPDNFLSYQYLQEIYTALNQPQKIGPLLDRAAKTEHKEPEFWLRLGGLYAEYFLKNSAAVKAPDAAASPSPSPEAKPAKTPSAREPLTGEAHKKTTAIFQKALAVANNDPEIVDRVADFYAATQQLEEAIPLYKRVIEVEPSKVDARENLARCYLGLNQRDNAVSALEELIQINPVQHHAYEFLANIYLENKEFDKAIANYEQSLLISPNQPQSYEKLAVLLIDNFKKPEKAVPVLTEARRRFPDQPWFSYLLAVSLSRTKQNQQALTVFEQTLLEAQNSQPNLLTSEFYFQYGATAEQAALYDKAGVLLKKALDTEDNPQQIAQTANYLGYMYVDHGQNLEEGGALIQRALEIDPDNGAYRDSLGWYYYRTNQFEKALVELKRAAELIKPEDSVVFEHLGDTYIKLKDAANAVNCWQKAISLDPESSNKAALAKKIEDSKAQLTQGGPPPAETIAAPDGKR